MKPLFQLCPVEHLEATVDYYRELGLRPLDWPDDDTVLLGRDTTGEPIIALVRDPDESALRAGGVFDAGDVDDFYAEHPELDWLLPPTDRSFGRYAVFADRTGTAIRLLDPLYRHAAVPALAVAS
jgi:catechol 2,3-dioxygenase-like lactoylglutathione lyase family enzyme